MADFFDPENSPFTGSNFRWTGERSLIRLPGLGQRPIQLRLRLLPVNPDVAARGPQAIEAWAAGRLIGSGPRPADQCDEQCLRSLSLAVRTMRVATSQGRL